MIAGVPSVLNDDRRPARPPPRTPARLNNCWPGKMQRLSMRPSSLAQAMIEPDSDTRRSIAHRPRPATSAVMRRRAAAARGEAQQFDRTDRRRRTAAHAVVQRDHLRHVGDRDLLARHHARPRADARAPATISARLCRPGSRNVATVAITMPRPAQTDAAARGHRRGHALQAQEEQRGGDEVAGGRRSSANVFCSSADSCLASVLAPACGWT